MSKLLSLLVAAVFATASVTALTGSETGISRQMPSTASSWIAANSVAPSWNDRAVKGMNGMNGTGE